MMKDLGLIERQVIAADWDTMKGRVWLRIVMSLRGRGWEIERARRVAYGLVCWMPPWNERGGLVRTERRWFIR